MANYYNTLLVCKSNSKLLQKINPRRIIKESNSEFLYSGNGMYYFTTRNGTMHDSIVALSEKYPDEIFIAQYWNVDFFDSEIQTFKYKSGKSKCTKVEPNYGYCISHIEKIMGKKTVERFMKLVLKQIKKIDSIKNIPSINTNGMEKKHNLRSSITINVENHDFRIEATKIGSSFIEVRGLIKDTPTPSWQLIEEEMNGISRVTHQIDMAADKAEEEKYESLPF